MKVLVTGATGYVGGRLVPYLLEQGYHVRALSRSLNKLKNRFWARHKNVELCEADVLDLDAMDHACENIDVVYYLVHSMLPSKKDFAEADRAAADNMQSSAAEKGVKAIIYLGGLGDTSQNLSKHLKSRHEVAEILKSGKVPVTELRAAMIIGSGSASFEILRYLVEHLPVMITPKWLETQCQPIAIRNVIYYLANCLKHPETWGETFDIGGPQIVTYHQLIKFYAEERGLKKRKIIKVPVLTPRLSSYWIHLVTPVPSYIARPLAEGLRYPVICKDERIQNIIEQDLLSPQKAIRAALDQLNGDHVMTHWTDAGPIKKFEWAYPSDPGWAGGKVLRDHYQSEVECTQEQMWKVILSIGGTTGWYHGNFLWKLRGWIDRLVGGVGLRRGRRDTDAISVGDALDFWRVALIESGKRLMLVAEMKVPGKAILEFKIEELEKNRIILHQIAHFKPKGLFGLAYWYIIMPLHLYLFRGMQRAMAKRAALVADKNLTGMEEIKAELTRTENELH